MLINEITIKNFKSIENVQFKTRRVNIFIGESNSGKSNLIEALSFFPELINFGEDGFKKVVRFENIGNLFFDNDIGRKIEISTNYQSVEIELETTGNKEIEFVFNSRFKYIPGLDFNDFDINDFGWSGNVNFAGGKIIAGGRLMPSYCTRMNSLDLLTIAKNKDRVLIFDGAASNTFPVNAKYIAEAIAYDKSNQYFLTTHNPFLLMTVVEKTPISELGIFITKNKHHQTKLYSLSEKDLEEVISLGHDVFFNLDKFTEKSDSL